MSSTSSTPETAANALDTDALRAQLTRCQALCEQALTTVDSLEGERSTFLAQNFEDSLQQLEVILRILEEDASDSARSRSGSGDQPANFLKRLARGLARRDETEESNDATQEELPDLRHASAGLQGNTWTFSLPELVGFLAASAKTGVLWVDSPGENYLLGMVDGQLVHAASSATPEGLRLGEILVELGFLTARQLERFLEGGDSDEHLSGESLLKAGIISEEELHTALSVQVQELFHRLLETNNAVFRFREGMQIMVAHHVYLNTTQLILESARVKDELEKNAELNALAQQLATLKPGETAPEEWATWDEEALSAIETLGGEDAQAAAGETTTSFAEASSTADDEPTVVELPDDVDAATGSTDEDTNAA